MPIGHTAERTVIRGFLWYESPDANSATLEEDACADVHLRWLARRIDCLYGEPGCVVTTASPEANCKPRMVHNLNVAISLSFECADSDVLAGENAPEKTEKNNSGVKSDFPPTCMVVPVHCHLLLKERLSAAEM